MKKSLLVILLSGLFLTGCSQKQAESILFDSNVNCTISVPRSDDREIPVEFQVPFCQLYSGDDMYSEFLADGSDLVVGEDVILSGKNVECLNGAEVLLSQYSFSECIKDNYYEKLSASYGTTYLGMDYLSATDAGFVKKVKKMVSPYEKNAFIVSALLQFSGCISDDVVIEKLTIPDMEFEYDFKHFTIETFDVPGDVKTAYDEEVIDWTSNGGLLVGSVLEPSGYALIGGVSNVDIKGMSIESSNEVCTVVNKDNYLNYADISEDFAGICEAQKLEGYKAGEEIDLEFDYVFSEFDQELIDADVVMASLIVKIQDESDNMYWDYLYEVNASDGPFLMMKLLLQKGIS